MNFSWPLIPVLGGYWFVVHWNRTRFLMKRRSGYHLFFWAAIAGMFLHIPGAVVVAVGYWMISLFYPLPSCFEKWTLFASDVYPCIAVSSFLSGFVLPHVANRFFPEKEATDDAAADNGDLLELLLAEAIDHTMPVALVLKSRKVHIGFALNNGIESQDGEFDIALIPLVSGYQEPDTLVLKLTTYYPQQIRESQESDKRSRLQSSMHRSIVIPLSQVLSARIFDPEGETVDPSPPSQRKQ